MKDSCHVRMTTVSEQCNIRLKEDFGGRDVMVRGADNVMMHMMFGMLALFAG